MNSKYRGKLWAGMHLLQDNAPIHIARVAVAEVANCGFELSPTPFYSPYSALSDFFSLTVVVILKTIVMLYMLWRFF